MKTVTLTFNSTNERKHPDDLRSADRLRHIVGIRSAGPQYVGSVRLKVNDRQFLHVNSAFLNDGGLKFCIPVYNDDVTVEVTDVPYTVLIDMEE